MMRDVVRIDRDRCTGCGECAAACEEGAIQMVDGKAALVREDYCDGLGACLPSCPAGAISIEKREAAAFSEHPAGTKQSMAIPVRQAQCAGSGPRTIARAGCGGPAGKAPGRLSQWPVQLRLAPVSAPYFRGCDLLVAADCTAFACGSFHEDFIRGKIVLIGCPKLDPGDCWEKLRAIIASNGIGSVTAVRMEVPCCGPLAKAAQTAAEESGIPFRTVILGIDGSIKG